MAATSAAMNGEHNVGGGFDRDRWERSVDGRTLYLTGSGGECTEEFAARQPVACGLCERVVMPIGSGADAHCPLCGFVP